MAYLWKFPRLLVVSGFSLIESSRGELNCDIRDALHTSSSICQSSACRTSQASMKLITRAGHIVPISYSVVILLQLPRTWMLDRAFLPILPVPTIPTLGFGSNFYTGNLTSHQVSRQEALTQLEVKMKASLSS